MSDSSATLETVRAALDGGPALGLGMLGDEPHDVPAGTAVVIATSGSSGIPKRVMLSAEALRASAEATAARIGSGRWLLALPSGYVAGLQVLVRSIVAGTEPVTLEGGFSPRAFAEATLPMLRPSAGSGSDTERLFTSLVPAQIATLVEAADDPVVRGALQAYTAILVGGQALPERVREAATALGARLVRTYGSSETSGGCVYDGLPLDTAAVRVVDGELWIAGPMLADGYLDDPALTERTFVRDDHGIRWYRTGDLGIVEKGVDGDVVRVRGRADNVIVSGGINISLDRVERIVRNIPGLEQAVVLGIPDERWGETSIIFAAAEDVDGGRMLDAARDLVTVEIGKHARPVQLELAPELPILASGKPDREALRRMIREASPGE